MNKNPDFNPKDDLQYKVAMKDMNIYEYKVNYLKNKGFKEEWGCPNFVTFGLFRTSSSC